MTRDNLVKGKLVTSEPAESTPVERLLDILTEIDAEVRKEPKRGAE